MADDINGASQGGGGTGGGGGGKKHHNGNKGGKGGGGRDKIDPKEIEQEYGLSYALFKAFPELQELLKKAVAQSWTAGRFQVELRQTNWFKNHSSSWRQNIALKYSDPADYANKVALVESDVRNLAASWGARLSDHAIRRLAERAFLLNLNAGQINDMLANHVLPGQGGHYGGQLSAIEENLRNVALRNGVRINKDQLRHWMRKIVRGNADQNQFEMYLRDVAAKTFGAYADQIRGGLDVADVAAPYIQSMADILELNPGSIDLYDKTIRKALSGTTDAKGKVVPMSIADFEDMLRADKRWAYTDNARNQMKAYAIAMAKMWGIQA